MENNFEIVCGVRSIKNDAPSTGKLTLCHIFFWLHNKQKHFFCMKNCL